MRILVTGFRPFLGEKVNPSEMLLQELRNEPDVDTLVLPVEYEGAFRVLKGQLKTNSYDLILLLGQATGSARIRLERVALNLMDSKSADEAGVIQLEKPIDPTGPIALTTSLRLRALWTKLNQPEAIEISNSAGAYVCNSTYYQCLRELQKSGVNSSCLFVHVPPLPDQGVAQSGLSMSFPEMSERVKQILQSLRSELLT